MDPSKLAPLRSGLLEFLVLDIVSSGEVYVADILGRLATTDFATREGTVYPLLSRMRREGLLDYDWRESTAGPPRKYYRLTRLGRDHLSDFREYWASLTTLIDELGKVTMDTTILIGLNGHAERYRLEANAYDRLERYLDRAASRLRDDPDQAEILGDLERSVGDKLAALPGSGDRLVTAADIDGVLEEIGAVDSGREPSPAETATPARIRRLQRIRERQKLAGVCAGLAAYAELDVAWVRTFFVLATVVTAGIFGLAYVALAFTLPVAETRET